MADIELVRRNLAKMIDQGAPEQDLDDYIKGEGLTLDQVKSGGAKQMEGPMRLPAMAGSEALRGAAGTVGLPMTAAQGIYNFIGSKVTGPAINAGQRALGMQETPYRDVTLPGTAEGLQGATKAAGLTERPDLKPQNVWEQVASLAAEGAGAGAPFGPLGAAAGAVGNMGGEAAAIGAKNLGGGPGAQTMARIGGSIALPAATGGIASQAGRTFSSFSGGAKKNPEFAMFERQGIRPTPSDVTHPNSMPARIESAAGRSIGGGPVVRANQAQLTDLERRIDDITGAFGTPTGREAGGSALQAGVKGYSERFKDYGRKLDDALLQQMPADTVVQPKFLDFIRDQKARYGADQNVGSFFENPELKRLLSAAEADIQASGGLRFGTLMNIRSEVGNMLNDPKLLNSIPQGQLRGLYGAVVDDVKSAVQSTGNQAAIKANDLRDKYWRAGAERLRQMQPVVREGVTPEQAFSRMFNEGKQGATRLWQLRRSMPQDEWDRFATESMNMLGRVGPDAPFDARVFLRNTQRMPDETLNAMFGGANRPQMAKDIRELSKISESISAGNKAIDPNIAGTAYLLNILGGGVGTMAGAASGSMTATGAVATAGTVLGPNMVARLMASPAFVRWLATPVPWERLPIHIDRLARLSGQAPEIADGIGELQNALKEGQNGR